MTVYLTATALKRRVGTVVKSTCIGSTYGIKVNRKNGKISPLNLFIYSVKNLPLDKQIIGELAQLVERLVYSCRAC